MILTGEHDGFLVTLSIAIAVIASFTALSLAGRARIAAGRVRRLWLAGAALALGGGIWSMHFVAMLAFRIPGMAMGYDPGITLLSLGIALVFTGAGFAVMDRRTIRLRQVIGAGLLMGSGVLAMHYIGMAAMRMPARIAYQPDWVAISAAIAIGAATTAVWLATRDQTLGQRIAASGAMGAAIAGMHYSGMHAAIFTADAAMPAAGGTSPGQPWLAVLIGTVTLVILLLALGAARIERLFLASARREARSAFRLDVADVLRGRDTQAALQEAAALMGRHFGVTRAGYGLLDPEKGEIHYEVCWTDGSVAPLLGSYPAALFGRAIVAALNAGETVAIADLYRDPRAADVRARSATGSLVSAILVVPFVRDGRLRTFAYLNAGEPRAWLREEITFMEEIAERTRLVMERAAVEDQLRELNATLEARVEARTEELRAAQAALLQSQKMEAIGQLVSGLAHDFNNVLGAIVGAFDLIRRRPEDATRVRRFADAGLEAAERGAKLTGQLLAFSRSQRIQLQPIFVCDVIEALRDMLARSLGPMIALEFQLNPVPVPVLADPTQVEMAVLNLAINARDAMPEGGVLRIATYVRHLAGDPELAPGDYVEIAVSDTGAGMEEAVLRRAMEPFFTTKPVGKGTGLGLAQAYGSARQAGGSVRIDSAPGEGTTVRVLLPCTDQRPDSDPAAAFAAPLTVQHARILLVDDDAVLRDMLASGLQAHGLEVIQAGDGLSALAAIDQCRPDIAVLDFAMPGMTGAELARRIGQRWPGLPVVFASGYADSAAIEAAVGDARVLRKPFRVDDLLRAIAGVLVPAG